MVFTSRSEWCVLLIACSDRCSGLSWAAILSSASPDARTHLERRYFPAVLKEDPIALMHAGNYDYTWSHMLSDQPGAVRHFWHYSELYMGMKGVHPRRWALSCPTLVARSLDSVLADDTNFLSK